MSDELKKALARLEGDASMAELVREAIHYYGDDKDGLARDIRIVLEHVKNLEADKARLDWLESKGVEGMKWVARPSTTGRGFRLHQSEELYACPGSPLQPTPRLAIDVGMESEK